MFLIWSKVKWFLYGESQTKFKRQIVWAGKMKMLDINKEKAMAPHSSTPAWKIPWMERPGRLHTVHGVAEGRTRLSDFTFTFHFHAWEKEMATRSSVLAWRIPGMGEPGGLPSMELHRVGHDWSDLAAAATGINNVLTSTVQGIK